MDNRSAENEAIPQNTPEHRVWIFDAINRERNKQDEEHGGPDHDDSNVSNDWIAFITYYLGSSIRGANSRWSFNVKTFRRNMVVVAAMAVAAVEWCDRRIARGDDN